jgi:hypothetical protein
MRIIRILSYYSIISVLLVSILLVTVPKSTFALSGSQFKAGRIIDDAYFYKAGTMSKTEIQNFLNSKVSSCDTAGNQNHTYRYNSSNGRVNDPNNNDPFVTTSRATYGQEYNTWNNSTSGNTPFTCLKDISINTPEFLAESGICSYLPAKSNQSAASIIYDVTSACGINPKAMIVLIQKEQGLVTDSWPFEYQRKFATGFCVYDTVAPPACEGTDGFFKQIYYAARQFKKYRADPGNYNYVAGQNNNIRYNPTASCGSSNVYIQNQATAGLYNYTPYQPNASALNNLYGSGDACGAYGNRNFWRYYNDWFGPTLTDALPGGASLKRELSTGKIYLVAEGKRYLVPSPEYLTAYKLSGISVESVNTTELNTFTNLGSLSNLIRESTTGKIYMVDSGNRYWVSGPSVCTDWEFDCFNSNVVKSLPDDLTYWLFYRGTVKPLARSANGVVYEVKSGKKSPMHSPVTLTDLGYSWGDVESLQSINTNQALGPLRITQTAVVRFSPDPKIYYYDGSTYHTIASPEILTAWGFHNKIVTPTLSSLNSEPPSTGESLGIFSQIGAAKYIIDNGSKVNLTDEQQELWPSANYQNFSAPESSKLANKTLHGLVRSSPHIYLLDGSEKRYIPTTFDLNAFGYNGKNLTSLSSFSLSTVARGVDAIGSGALIKLSGDSKIYVVSNDNIKHIPGPSVFNDYGYDWSKIRSVSNNFKTRYSESGALSNAVALSGGYSFFENGRQIYVPGGYYTDEFGLITGSFQQVNDGVAQFRNRSVIKRFMRNGESGAIYYGSGGEIHYVSSMESFRSYGGDTTNMMSVRGEFINLFRIGKPI